MKVSKRGEGCDTVCGTPLVTLLLEIMGRGLSSATGSSMYADPSD